MFIETSACHKKPWESRLAANNAMTKNFLLNSHPDFISFEQFLCPRSLKRPKIMSQETFSDTLIRLEAFKRIFVFFQKIDYFPRG